MTQFMPGSMCCEVDWVVEYSRWESSFKHGFKFAYDEFNQIKEFLATLSQPVYIAESHAKLFDVVLATNQNIELVNLDFHSDMAVCKFRENLDCGNWISALARYKNCKIGIDWCQLHSKRRGNLPDTGEADSGVKYKHSRSFDGIFEQKYDIVFLCQNHEFSPPHLNHRFRELVNACRFPYISKDSPPFYPTYSERVQYASQFEYCYILTGLETSAEMDKIYDDEELLVVHPVEQISDIPDCDPMYRK